MSTAWTHRARFGAVVAFAVWIAGPPTLGQSQATPKAPAPAPRTIVLPNKVVMGAPATLAVLDSSGRLVPGVEVELSSGQKIKTDATGRALFAAPNSAGKLIARISGKQVTGTSEVVVSPGNVAADRSTVDDVKVSFYPRVLAVYDQFVIEGAGFRGAADVNHVFLADQACLILAASPVSLVVLPGPKTPVGAIDLRVNVAGQSAVPMSVSSVLLEFSSPVDVPTAGTQGKLILSVHGSMERLTVEVRNGSPAIIQFPRGNLQRVETSGGEQNSAPVDLKFLSSGSYVITAKLAANNSSSLPVRVMGQRQTRQAAVFPSVGKELQKND